MDPLGWMSNLLWKGIVKCHLGLLTFSKTTLVSKIIFYYYYIGMVAYKTRASFYMFFA